MKIKKVVDMCRREGVVRIYEDDNGIQWLSNGYACYPLYNVPQFSEDEFFTLFDFTSKQREETVFQCAAMPENISTLDTVPGEQLCEKLSPNIPYGSKLLMPYSTPGGIKFLDDDYLAPLVGDSGEMEIYERVSKKGEHYFVVKIGMCVRAIVTPFNAINKSFVDNISTIHALCREALITKEATETVQLSAFESNDD